MKWVTRAGVHLDRVATPWLITRFVDQSAEFFFIRPGVDPIPDDATPFGMAGAELSPHDADGSTFRKVLRKYEITDEALDYLAGIVEAGIAVALSLPAEDVIARYPEGAGLNAFSEGMLFSGKSDQVILGTSAPVYDALYTYSQAKVLERDLDAEVLASPAKRMGTLKKQLSRRS